MARGAFDEELAAARDDLERLVRRLRSLSPRAWRDRRTAAEAALTGLVAIEAKLEDIPLECPSVADHVLADAISVVGGDILGIVGISRDPQDLESMGRVVREALNGTR